MSHIGISVRPASTPADIADVAALFRAYAASLDVDLCFQGFDAELRDLPGKYAPPRGALLIARDPAGRPLGCVALRPLDDADQCEMKRLYVAPEGRGLGVGAALAEAVVAAARARGYGRIRLDTLPSMAAAQALYRRMGFVDIAPYYDTPVVGTRFLELTL